MSKLRNLLLGAALIPALAAPVLADKMGLGRTALPEEVDAWDVSVLPDGKGLRPGSGDVATGEAVFADKCSACHGDFAEGIDNWPVLAGGDGSLQDRRPVKTIGSYWPHLSTAWDYIHRSMPFGEAQTVSVDETYAIVAFLLYSNGIVDEDFVLTNENFTSVKMPNADGFYPDDRAESEYPLFTHDVCMKDCIAPVKVTKRAVTLNVTPMDPDGEPAGTLPDLHLASAGDVAAAPATEAAEEPAAEADTETATEATETAAPAGPDPALVEAGMKVFGKCKACHKVGEGAKNGTGPVLNGVVGRTAGTYDGFKYSKAMKAEGENGMVWSHDTLDAYLADPKGFLKGNRMSFAGLKKDDDRAAVIAYLESLGH